MEEEISLYLTFYSVLFNVYIYSSSSLKLFIHICFISNVLLNFLKKKMRSCHFIFETIVSWLVLLLPYHSKINNVFVYGCTIVRMHPMFVSVNLEGCEGVEMEGGGFILTSAEINEAQ